MCSLMDKWTGMCWSFESTLSNMEIIMEFIILINYIVELLYKRVSFIYWTTPAMRQANFWFGVTQGKWRYMRR